MAAVKAIRASLGVNKRTGFTIGQVAGIKARCHSRTHSIRVVHAPVASNKAHSEVLDLPENEIGLLEELATNEWSTLLLNTAVEEDKNPAPDQSAYNAC